MENKINRKIEIGSYQKFHSNGKRSRVAGLSWARNKIFGAARYGVGDFSSFVGCKKSIVCLTLSKKRTGKAAWVVAFFNSCRLLAGRIFVW